MLGGSRECREKIIKFYRTFLSPTSDEFKKEPERERERERFPFEMNANVI